MVGGELRSRHGFFSYTRKHGLVSCACAWWFFENLVATVVS